jgi:DNA-binding response OmpR family regulator
MEGNLAGHSVLIVEDEPLIALHIRMAFEKAGANAITVYSLRDAFRHVEQDGLSGAVLDCGLGSQDGDALCRHLRQRDIPFILHSGYQHISECLSWRNRHSDYVSALSWQRAESFEARSPEPDLYYQAHYADRS